MKYISYVWVFALSLYFAFPPNGFSTSNELLDLSDMTETASAIVMAEVVASQVDSSDNRGLTVVNLRVTGQIKGITQEFITLTLPGGSYTRGRFRVGEVVAGAPQLFANQDVLLFLAEGQQSNNYSLVGYTQGLLSIRDNDGQQVVQGNVTDGQVISIGSMVEKILQVEAE